jgi:PAS domain S-box-containing protein
MSKPNPEQLLKLIVDAHPGLVTYINKNYYYEYASQGYESWFGVHPQDVIGKSLSEIPGIDHLEEKKLLIDCALNGKEVTFSGVLNHASLGQRDVEQFYKPDFAEDESIRGIIVLIYDVTEQKNAERIAKENEARFRSLTENMPQLVWMANADGNLIWFNQNWSNATGTKLEDNLGAGWLNILHPDDRGPTLDNWNRGMKTNRREAAEYRLKMADGKYRWHLARAFPIYDEDGKLIRWVGTTTDIEKQKEVEVYQSRLLQVMDSSSDFIGMADTDGRGIYLNKAACQLVGLDSSLKPNDVQILDFFMERDREYVIGTILPTTKLEGKWVGEFRFRHFQTGLPIWVHYNSFVTYDLESGKPTGFATVARDIGELKKKEHSLQEALKTRDHFLSMASHELKTPLTSLMLLSQILMRNINFKKQFAQEKLVAFALQTNELVNRLTHLIDDMLDVSRIKSGKLSLNKTACDLGGVVLDVVTRMSTLFEATGADLPALTLMPGVLGMWDRFRLEQVIGNLLTNALRYGRGKQISVSVSKQNGTAVLAVKDLGYGINKEDLFRIFERHERATNTSGVSGLGLGLFISREILESHGGRIWAESEVGHGSTFYVTLPLEENI